MAKQVMGSDLIAQPSFWPELEPVAPAPRLRQPKPSPEAGAPEPDSEQRPPAEVLPGAAGPPSEAGEIPLDPSELAPAHPAGPGPVAGEVALPSPSLEDLEAKVSTSGDSPAMATHPQAASAVVPLESPRLESSRSSGALMGSDHRDVRSDGAPALVQLPTFRSGPAGRPLPERLLILDTETTGLRSERDHCIEIGAVLFHVAERAVLDQVSFLLPCQENPAEPINGISAAVSRTPQPWQAGLLFFEAMLEAADLVVAHNVKFDRAWFGRGPLPVITKPWLCTMEDIRWPPALRLKATPSVRDLALAYAVPVWAAHRALTDCIYLAQVFERCGDLETLLLEGLEPRQLYRARLSYAERHRAREAGFRWNEPLRGAWSRRLSQREVALLPFPVEPADADSFEAI